MAERIVVDQAGRHWTADQYALAQGYAHDEVEFARVMQEDFGVHTYERMQQLWRIRDSSKRRYASGSFPEGADIGKAME